MLVPRDWDIEQYYTSNNDWAMNKKYSSYDIFQFLLLWLGYYELKL